jgi:HD-like signal output (HDOD) protein
MLNESIRKKLDSIRQLPSVPHILSEVLSAVDNLELSAKALATLIERDQSLTARVLTVANSPYYGFSRRVSTVDLAIVVMGMNSIKEIVLSLLLKRFLKSIRQDLFNIGDFWNYSVFCGSTSKLLAKKLDYRVTGEAFVGGLMHDIGYLILVEYLPKEFSTIKDIQAHKNCSLYDAEMQVLEATHCDLGGWLADKWNLPAQLCNVIKNHHNKYIEKNAFPILDEDELFSMDASLSIAKISEPLTVIVSVSEWFAEALGYKSWSQDKTPPPLFFSKYLFDEIFKNDLTDTESSIELLRQEILDEYDKVAEMNESSVQPL